MRTSSVRLIRKLVGIVLLVINTTLSLMSALAMYSIVEFASDADNYDFNVASPITYNFTISPNGYINLGSMTINNTGLFDFNDFEIRFEFNNQTNGGLVRLLSFNGSFGDVPAGEKKVLDLTLKNDTVSRKSLWVNPALNDMSTINPANVSGFLEVTGKYVLALFRFDFRFTNLSLWTWT
ncbi:MAG: hypothetical protein Q6373_018605 [Candidatus Sigynarchaeota archaeon]